MLKELVLRITAAGVFVSLLRIMLPAGSVSKTAQRVFALIETWLIAEPIVRMLMG